MISLEFVRSFRILEYAFFDLGVSFLAMALLAPLLSTLFLKIKLDVPKLNWLFLILPLSILVHALTGNYTQMTKNFLNPSDHYYLKGLIIVFTVLGVRGIKKIK